MERREIDIKKDTMKDFYHLMSEGNPGAITVLGNIMSNDPISGFNTLLHLDDMNIRGSQIWVAFKDYCKKDLSMLVEAVFKRDPKMVSKVNEFPYDWLATTGGASDPGVRKTLAVPNA